MEKTTIDLIREYAEEYQRDTTFDAMNITEYSMKTHSLKGKWIETYSVNKARLVTLVYERGIFIDENVEKLIKASNEGGRPLQKSHAERVVKKSDKYRKMDFKIKELEVLVEFFENYVKAMHSLGFDVKNAVEMIKIDQM